MTLLSDNKINSLYKSLILTGLFLFLVYTLLFNHYLDPPPQFLVTLSHNGFFSNDQNDNVDSVPTNISHIVIGVAGSVNSWKSRKPYVESWWRPNVTKGYLFLDREPTDFLPWPTSSPQYRIYGDTSRYQPYNKHPMKHAIRMVRVILETFNEAHDEGIRWYVMADDDTIFFLDNLVDVLSRYDHTKYFYIGGNSESVLSNVDNSFEMAFGGAGYAISYPLAAALAKNLDVCIKRYPYLYGSDHLLQSCVTDLGVPLTHEKGFHQIDLHKDVSGYLSAHPHAPFLSLHHLDTVFPLFPSMNRSEALYHLMEAAKIDQSRLLQQTICYAKSKKQSYSISWGYSAHVYEKIIPPSVLEKPLETFVAWRKTSGYPYMFNIRWLSKDPCEMPHAFFFDSVEEIRSEENQIVTSYTRRFPRNMPLCPSASNNVNSTTLAASDIAKIIVVTPATKYIATAGNRKECCDVVDQVDEKNVTMIKYRACTESEIVGVNID